MTLKGPLDSPGTDHHGGLVFPGLLAEEGAVSLHGGGEGMDERPFPLPALHPGRWFRQRLGR